MLKIGAGICLVFVGFLAFMSSGISTSPPVSEVTAAGAEGGVPIEALSSTTDEGLSIWLRLRWIFAGVATSAIVLLSLRQLRILDRRMASRSPLTHHHAETIVEGDSRQTRWSDVGHLATSGD